ncbi:formate dehydrogenase-N subunit alpha [Anaerobacillus arseniciselenatis]|nr:formate dehydrogenase-N subunit alpha [Anaerobacillus arseniciselenatis]
MTNHWNDIQHTDCALIIGANPAENHPISMKFVQKAKERGATVISADPRYTRTSTQAHIYAPFRSGTDIPLIGGLIHYAIENDLIHKEYVVNYTNASFLVNEDYQFNDGIFSGYDENSRSYDQSTWTFQTDEDGNILKDETLQHPRSVYQLMKEHYSRYDVDTVCSVTGTPKEDFLKMAEAFCATGQVGKSGTIMYAMGTTQHTVGSQNVRAYGLIQLLLGNIGVPGGGVNAMRGECNVQGSTDMALLFHILPGYLPAPTGTERHKDLASYNKNETPHGGWWNNRPKYLVSLLKAWYGDAATKENDFLYDYLPKNSRNSSHISLFEAMYDGDIKGMLVWGQNPIVGGPNTTKEQKAMENLDWLVAIDLWETETAAFWKQKAGSNPESINTEVFMLPACGPYEKEGAVTNSSRWKQFRWKALEPKGEAKADAWICHNLAKRVKKLYQGDNSTKGNIINALNWSFGDGDYPSNDLINREINGYDLTTGKTVLNFTQLQDDGTTSCGNWIYSGVYPDAGPDEEKNRAKDRDNKDTGMENYLNWSFAWPLNRRILYNRASADLNGQPWSDDKKVIWWDGETWANSYDVPDFAAVKAPGTPAEPGAPALAGHSGDDPFIMNAHGHGGLFAPMNDGPFPEHYEPYESPVPNAFSSVDLNPAVVIWTGDYNEKGDRSQFPIVVTTYRLTEHWQSGSMTRNLEWLSELQGHMFVELSEELAEEKGIKNKDKVVISSARGEIEAYAMVTKRFKPYTIRGEKVHHIGMPWHWGYMGITTGAIANTLTPHIGDANTMIPEYKAFLGDVRRAD